MSWSPQQSAALAYIKKWYESPTSSQLCRLFGFAGTGKTYLAKEVDDNISGKVLFACFTGKAALVLRKKGCSEASTIHSLIYRASQCEITGDMSFELNTDGAMRGAKLVIIDEVSMVNEEIALDLLSFGIKILVLGDPAQLPPVKGEGFFINATPDIMLTEIHRQAADNPIIRMSMDVREGKQLQVGNYGDSMVIARRAISPESMRAKVMQADQILCGLNKTRQLYNERVRLLKGFAKEDEKGKIDWRPTMNEKLVCLKNNKQKGLLNGGLWETIGVSANDEQVHLMLSSMDEENAPIISATVLPPFFNGTEKQLHWQLRKQYDEFTYGYCLTVHKSQGSQWDDVVLFDESYSFREDWRKHLYTGITRAAERITVVI